MSKTEVRRTLDTVCKNCDTEIMHWIHYAKAGEIPQFPRSIEITEPNKQFNKKLFIHDGGIQEISCDVIVLSVNAQLKPKSMGGVHAAAGPQLKEAVKNYDKRQIGDVVETPGFDLPAEHVFHLVTSVGEKNAEVIEKLEQCYYTALNLASERSYSSIALPALSSGSKMVKDAAANVGLKSIRLWLEEHPDTTLQCIILCRYTDDDRDVYDKFLHRWFPIKDPIYIEPRMGQKK